MTFVVKEQIEVRDPTLRSGFVQIPKVVISDPTLSSHAKVVYALLLAFAWQNDRCFPGQARLAAMMGITERYLRAAVGQLVRKRLIAVQRRGLGRTNLYVILPLANAYPELKCPEITEFKPDGNYSSGLERNPSSAKVYSVAKYTQLS